ncbi:MAG TPA: PIN domain-containing protein [Candidatus Paceibacterota bacterium]|nr:PIN domain-containing protein [Verrucomicrobiota bacterium]HRZ94514.1 PIN domain-containing protein [Candidatus Paceibacterota bacterium]
MNVLVDTCVWSQFLRRNRPRNDPVALEVERLIRADVVAMIGPIRQELLSGAQPATRFAQLKDYLRFYPNLSLDEEDDENAAGYYNLCRQQGVQGTATDLLICAVAVRHGLRIFTSDTDFDLYARHLPITRHPFRTRPG